METNKVPERVPSNTSAPSDYDVEHNLVPLGSSTKRTDTEVEQIAERIEQRRAERLNVTHNARVRFLKESRKIAVERGSTEARISKKDVLALRDRIQTEVDQGKGICNHPLVSRLGIYSDVTCLADILDGAVELLETDRTGNYLYYRDFSFDYTRTVSRYPHMRHPLGGAAIVVFLYYFFTVILFCHVVPSSTICAVPEEGGYTYGWVSALYFASTTISTVGYGDLTVDQDPKYKSFIGSLYMLVSMVVAVVAFSAIADSSFSPMEKFFEKIFDRFDPKEGEDMFLYERIRKIKFVKIAELAVEITTFIMLGVFATRIVIYFDESDPEDGTQWTWMTSLYWAVQTATTIGYGDLDQPDSLRYFKIFYLMISTVLVGNALGKLGSLKLELQDLRRRHAFERRPVTKRMIDEMQAYDHDDKVDQYEFLVSSLVGLGKITSEDIKPIMDKFRVQAGDKNYIAVHDEFEEDNLNEEHSEELQEQTEW